MADSFLQIPRSSLVDLPSEVLNLVALGVYSIYSFIPGSRFAEFLLLVANDNQRQALYFIDYTGKLLMPIFADLKNVKNIDRAVQIID
jgi:hypothetical protein